MASRRSSSVWYFLGLGTVASQALPASDEEIQELVGGFQPSSWENAGDARSKYLRVAVHDCKETTTSTAQCTSSISLSRHSLVKKGFERAVEAEEGAPTHARHGLKSNYRVSRPAAVRLANVNQPLIIVIPAQY